MCRTGSLLVCGQDRDGPLEVERASSYQVTPGRLGLGPGTAGESFAGQQVRVSRISGQAAPGLRALPGGQAQLAVDLAGDVTLEAADGLCLGLAFGGTALGVGAGGRVGAQAGEYDPPQGVAGLPVTARVEAVPGDFPDDAGIGAAPRRCAQAASLRSRSW